MAIEIILLSKLFTKVGFVPGSYQFPLFLKHTIQACTLMPDPENASINGFRVPLGSCLLVNTKISVIPEFLSAAILILFNTLGPLFIQ